MIVLLSILLGVSVILNIALAKIVKAQLKKVEIYEGWIVDFQNDVDNTFSHMKTLDDRQIFEKDDEVGVVFQDMVNLIDKLNERTTEKTPEE